MIFLLIMMIIPSLGFGQPTGNTHLIRRVEGKTNPSRFDHLLEAAAQASKRKKDHGQKDGKKAKKAVPQAKASATGHSSAFIAVSRGGSSRIESLDYIGVRAGRPTQHKAESHPIRADAIAATRGPDAKAHLSAQASDRILAEVRCKPGAEVHLDCLQPGTSRSTRTYIKGPAEQIVGYPNLATYRGQVKVNAAVKGEGIVRLIASQGGG